MTVHCNFSIHKDIFFLNFSPFILNPGINWICPIVCVASFHSAFYAWLLQLLCGFQFISLSLFYSLSHSTLNIEDILYFVCCVYCVYCVYVLPVPSVHCWHSTLHQIQSAIVSSLIIIFHFLTWATQQKETHRKLNRIK